MGLFRKLERWVTRTQYRYVDTHLEGYQDKDEILLHAAFSVLVDYVEIELAWMNLICGDEQGLQKWWEMRKLAWGGRDPESGLRHLDWELGLTHEGKTTCQAISAQEIKDLYLWWKGRSSRQDPYDAAGFPEAMKSVEGQKKPEDFPEMALWAPSSPALSAASRRANEIEEGYHAEDEAMLIRLAKVRRSLWT